MVDFLEQNPSFKQKLSEYSKNNWANENFSIRRIQEIKEYWSNEDNRINQSIKKKKYLSNTENLERHRLVRCKYNYVVKNIETGETYNTNSISLFSKQHNLGKSKLLNTFLGQDKNGISYLQHKGYKIISKELI